MDTPATPAQPQPQIQLSIGEVQLLLGERDLTIYMLNREIQQLKQKLFTEGK
jgi:hypothetical protein